MADWTRSARTNYVKFADLNGLTRCLEMFGGDIYASESLQMEGRHCILSRSGKGWDSNVDGDNDAETISFCLLEHVCPFLAPGQTLVCMEIGSEKLHYLTGTALAFHYDGKTIAQKCISLSDICGIAVAAFGVTHESITSCTY